MALANIGHLLSAWGYKVLLVDWDLEAPGLENFFSNQVKEDLSARKGLIDLIHEAMSDNYTPVPDFWKPVVCKIFDTPNRKLDLITAGRRVKNKSGKKDSEYYEKVRLFDVKTFYKKNNGGNLIERFRTEWKKEYDFVLVDSRTGITEIGGICTIQLPDILVLFFTSTVASFNGIADVAIRAKMAHQELLVERLKLLTLPILTRVDGSEKDLTKSWISNFISGASNIPNNLADIYKNWMPDKVDIKGFINQTKVPHVAFYSFGEGLPVEEKNFETDLQGIGYTYQSIAALLATTLNFPGLLKEDRAKLLKLANKNSLTQIKNELLAKIKEEITPVINRNTEKSNPSLFQNNKSISTQEYNQLIDHGYEDIVVDKSLQIADIMKLKGEPQRAVAKLDVDDLMESNVIDSVSEQLSIRIFFRIMNTDPDILFLLKEDINNFIHTEICQDTNSRIGAEIQLYNTDLAKNISDKLNYLLSDQQLLYHKDEITEYVLGYSVEKIKPETIATATYNTRKIFTIASSIIALLLSIYLVYKNINNYKARRHLKDFKAQLAALPVKDDAELKNKVCSLANFDNSYNNRFIESKKDSLAMICTLLSKIDSSNSIITQASSDISLDIDSSRKIAALSNEIAVKEQTINKNLLIISTSKDSVEKKQLRTETIRLNRSVDSLIEHNPIFKFTSPASNLIGVAQQRVDSTLNIKNNPSKTVSSSSAWFKEGYFLQFGEIKVLLLELTRSYNSIKIEICDMVGATTCKNPIATVTMTTDKPYSFNYGKKRYVITLDRIGRAGKNAFTLAAYITFSRQE
jgi:hypothetical protein